MVNSTGIKSLNCTCIDIKDENNANETMDCVQKKGDETFLKKTLFLFGFFF